MPHLAKNDFLMRQDRNDSYLNYSICKALGTQTTEIQFIYTPKPVFVHKDVTVLWKQEIHTEKLGK
jgi:hypothetical protein